MDSSKHEVVIAVKSVLIVQHLACDSMWWQEDKYALQQFVIKLFFNDRCGYAKNINLIWITSKNRNFKLCFISAKVPNAVSWASQFIATAHLLESYMLLHHHKEAKTLLYKFRAIDPDRADRLTTEKSEIIDKVLNKHQTLDELAFLTQFAFVLKQAGYEKIPDEMVKECIEKSHKYDNVEVRYLFIDY